MLIAVSARSKEARHIDRSTDKDTDVTKLALIGPDVELRLAKTVIGRMLLKAERTVRADNQVADIAIDVPAVSAKHCVISCDVGASSGGGPETYTVTIMDRSSRHGLLVNKIRLLPHEGRVLHDGDLITLPFVMDYVFKVCGDGGGLGIDPRNKPLVAQAKGATTLKVERAEVAKTAAKAQYRAAKFALAVARAQLMAEKSAAAGTSAAETAAAGDGSGVTGAGPSVLVKLEAASTTIAGAGVVPGGDSSSAAAAAAAAAGSLAAPVTRAHSAKRAKDDKYEAKILEETAALERHCHLKNRGRTRGDCKL